MIISCRIDACIFCGEIKIIQWKIKNSGARSESHLPVRQIRIAMYNLERLDTHPTLWGRTHEERWGAVDDVAQKLNEQLGKTALMTGAQFALRHIDESQKQPKAKCPFTPQREMIAKLWGADGPVKQQTLFD